MKIFRNEDGQMFVLTAASMGILFGMMAISLDVSNLYRTKRDLQIAADAAAIAGANNYQYKAGTSASISTAAKAAALANGIPNAYVGVSTSGTAYHTGTGFVEVDITYPVQTVFGGVFGSLTGSGNLLTTNVGAHAVAGVVGAQACIYVLDPSDPDVVDVQGNATINSPGCAIQINSTSGGALCTKGGKATINSPSIRIAGGQSGSSPCNSVQQNVQTGAATTSDPFSSLTWPTCPTSGNGYSAAASLTTTTQVAAITAKSETIGTNTVNVVCFANAVTISPAAASTCSHLIPGSSSTTSCVQFGTPVDSGNVDSSGNEIYTGSNSIWVFEKGLTLGGDVEVSGTIDMGIAPGCSSSCGGTFSQANSILTIYGPASKSDPYNSLALMVDPANTTINCTSPYGGGNPSGTQPCIQIQFGSGYGDLNGILYCPSITVFMQDSGNGSNSVVAGIISYKLYDKSSQLNVTDNYNTDNAATTPLSRVALVE